MSLVKDKTYTFYIYALCDAGNTSVFNYVGRTVNPQGRLSQHNRWREDNELPSVDMRILASTDTNEKCAQLERHYIHKLLGKGHPLTNRNHKDHICWKGCPAAGHKAQQIDILKPRKEKDHRVQCVGVWEATGKPCFSKTTHESRLCQLHRRDPATAIGRGNYQRHPATRCRNGHEMTPENTSVYSDQKARKCVACSIPRLVRQRAGQRKRREIAKENKRLEGTRQA